jgi:signal peptidase II
LVVIALLLAVLLAVADQLFKLLTVVYLKPRGTRPVLDGFLELEYVENRGAAFSILQDRRWFFVSVTVILCVDCVPDVPL